MESVAQFLVSANSSWPTRMDGLEGQKGTAVICTNLLGLIKKTEGRKGSESSNSDSRGTQKQHMAQFDAENLEENKAKKLIEKLNETHTMSISS